jgi:Domain of unknown function (DUF1839)
LDAQAYVRHELHAEGCAWPEKNCYADFWIELLHGLKLDPFAMLGFTVALDFEGDQWTFFKPSHDDLYSLYGVDVQELTVWRPLLDHAVEHLSAGKLIATESDAFWLPDTAGTDYRRQHTKTTIVLTDLDVANKQLGYFHNAGYYQLSGEDFDQTFRVGRPHDPTFMPLFAELIRIDRVKVGDAAQLRVQARALLNKYIDRMPRQNPVLKFAQRFATELPNLQQQGLATYHAWAFANTRQLGAAGELIAAHLRWLDATDDRYMKAAEAFDAISASAKTFILKGARAVNSKRAMDAAPMFDELALRWDSAAQLLR